MSELSGYNRYWQGRLAFHYRRKLFQLLRRNESIWQIQPLRAFTSYYRAWNEMLSTVTGSDGPWISEVEYYCHLEPLLNRVESSDAAADKNEYEGGHLADVVVPAIVHYVRGRWFEAGTLSPLSEESVVDRIRELDTVVIKPSRSGGGGAGVEVYRKGDLRITANLTRPYDYVVQPGIRNSEWFRKWNPDSLNTLRIMTLRDSGDVRLVSAFLRFGSPGSATDNLRSGGWAIGVTDGTLASYGIDVDLRRTDRLPDGRPIPAGSVPGFAEAVDLCRRGHRGLLAFDVVSWDIAFCESNKPAILELNLSSQGISAHQAVNGPVLRPLVEAVGHLKGIRW